jgi:hypothetical protein
MALAWLCYFNITGKFKSLGYEGKIRYFDFKKGEDVVDYGEGYYNQINANRLTMTEALKIMNTGRKSEEDELRSWLLS